MVKFIVNSSGLEFNFRELKDSVALLDNVRKGEISIGEQPYKQEGLNRYLRNKNWK